MANDPADEDKVSGESPAKPALTATPPAPGQAKPVQHIPPAVPAAAGEASSPPAAAAVPAPVMPAAHPAATAKPVLLTPQPAAPPSQAAAAPPQTAPTQIAASASAPKATPQSQNQALSQSPTDPKAADPAEKPAAPAAAAAKPAAAAPDAAKVAAAKAAAAPAKVAAAKAVVAKAAATTTKPAAPAAKSTVKVLPMATAARLKLRHKGLMASFLIVVALPLLLTFYYLEARAVDRYASTLGFTVRSEELKSASDLLGGMGAVLGGGSSSRDSDILYEFIRSQEMVAAVDAKLDLRALYGRHYETDPLMGLAPNASIEALTSHWQRMVQISYDSASGLMELQVQAFTPEEAQEIAKVIVDESTKMINDLSVIARQDAMRYASEDLDIALERLKEAREAITAFRLRHRIVDVNADIQGQMGLVNTLQAQLASALIEYDLLRNSARPGDPRLDQAQSRIAVIEDRIAQERAKFGSTDDGQEGEDSYATTVAEFERLTVEREFAEATYLAALRALDGARAEASRKSRYLASYIRPTLAQTSEYPQVWLIMGLVGLFSFLTWSILSLVFYALRDRR